MLGCWPPCRRIWPHGGAPTVPHPCSLCPTPASWQFINEYGNPYATRYGTRINITAGNGGIIPTRYYTLPRTITLKAMYINKVRWPHGARPPFCGVIPCAAHAGYCRLHVLGRVPAKGLVHPWLVAHNTSQSRALSVRARVVWLSGECGGTPACDQSSSACARPQDLVTAYEVMTITVSDICEAHRCRVVGCEPLHRDARSSLHSRGLASLGVTTPPCPAGHLLAGHQEASAHSGRDCGVARDTAGPRHRCSHRDQHHMPHGGPLHVELARHMPGPR